MMRLNAPSSYFVQGNNAGAALIASGRYKEAVVHLESILLGLPTFQQLQLQLLPQPIEVFARLNVMYARFDLQPVDLDCDSYPPSLRSNAYESCLFSCPLQVDTMTHDTVAVDNANGMIRRHGNHHDALVWASCRAAILFNLGLACWYQQWHEQQQQQPRHSPQQATVPTLDNVQEYWQEAYRIAYYLSVPVLLLATSQNLIHLGVVLADADLVDYWQHEYTQTFIRLSTGEQERYYAVLYQSFSSCRAIQGAAPAA